MIIAAMHEPKYETRTAITPTAIKNYIKLGLEVLYEQKAGERSGFSDKEYKEAGAFLLKDKKTLLKKTNILVTINEPSPKNIIGLQPNSLIITQVESDINNELLTWCCQHQISLFSLNHVPRISRAQNIDTLSSQANLAGYRGLLEGVANFNRAIPMMMTAAGMIQPAKVLILGAGVAGLQAIATAKRLGAIVYAFDVRAAAKEQVNSLGAEFIEVGHEKLEEASSGYAQETSSDYKNQQATLIDQYARLSDIVICTALIPGKKAPLLLTRKTVEQMKPGSVIVDLATARGGNCELSVQNKIIKHRDITLVGYSNMAGLIPATASDLYANNLVHLAKLLIKESSTLTFSPKDEIIQQAVLCHQAQIFPFKSKKEQ